MALSKKAQSIKKMLDRNRRQQELKIKKEIDIVSKLKFKDVVPKLRQAVQKLFEKNTGEVTLNNFISTAALKTGFSKNRISSAILNKTFKDDEYQFFVDNLLYNNIMLSSSSNIILTPSQLLDKLINEGLPFSWTHNESYIDYVSFTKSIYWRSLRDFMFKRIPKCEKCSSSNNLSLHHKTYAYRGDEWNNLNSLEVLCKHCHLYAHSNYPINHPKWRKYLDIPQLRLIDLVKPLRNTNIGLF